MGLLKNPRSQSEGKVAATMANDLRYSASTSELGRNFPDEPTAPAVRPCPRVSGSGAVIRVVRKGERKPDIRKSLVQPILQILTVPGTVRMHFNGGILYALLPWLYAHVLARCTRDAGGNPLRGEHRETGCRVALLTSARHSQFPFEQWSEVFQQPHRP